MGGPLSKNTNITGSSSFSLSLGTSVSKLVNLTSYASNNINIISITGSISSALSLINTQSRLSYTNAGDSAAGSLTFNSNGTSLQFSDGGGQVSETYFTPTSSITRVYDFNADENNFQVLYDPISVGDGSSDNRFIITDFFGTKGIVYADDYTANFTTHSLVTKGYVDSVSGGVTASGNGVTASGTVNYVSKFTGNNILGDSQLFDNGSFVGINTTTQTSSERLRINGHVLSDGGLNLGGYSASYTNNTLNFLVNNIGASGSISGSGNRRISMWYDTGSGGSNTDFYGYDMVFYRNTDNYKFLKLEGGTGNIGIGTASPSSKLHILSTQNDGIRLESIQSGHYLLLSPGNNSFGPSITSTYALELKNPSAEFRLGRTSGSGNALIYVDSTVNSGLNLSANSGGSPAITIISSGYVGINSTNPSTFLHVVGTQSGAFRLVDTTEGVGKVLTSDVNGVGTWADIGSSLCEFYNDGSSIGATLSTLYTTSGLIDTSNLLAKNGDRFKGVFGGYFTGATASTKSIQLYYGGNPLFGSVATAYESPSYWRVEFCIIRSAINQIRYDVTFTIYDNVNNTSRTEQVAGAYGIFDFTTDEVIELMGQSIGVGTLDGDIISRVGHIDYVISR